MNDHLTDMDAATRRAVAGGADARWRRSSTTCPGMRVGHAVLSNTFRHPVLLAKAATVLDHATGGRFVLGLGAGWFEGEHEPFGIPLPPIGERDRPADLRGGGAAALFSPEARRRAGRHAARTRSTRCAAPSTRPAPLTPGRPADLPGRPEAARASRWRRGGPRAGCCRAPRPATSRTSRDRRDAILARARGGGPRPGDVRVRRPGARGADRATRAAALEQARALVAAGATEMVIGVPAALGPTGSRTSRDEVARAAARGGRFGPLA